LPRTNVVATNPARGYTREDERIAERAADDLSKAEFMAK